MDEIDADFQLFPDLLAEHFGKHKNCQIFKIFPFCRRKFADNSCNNRPHLGFVVSHVDAIHPLSIILGRFWSHRKSEQLVFLPVFFLQLFHGWPGRLELTPFSALQAMSEGSDSEGQVQECRIISDQAWLKSLSSKEAEWLKSNLIPAEELEDRKVVCTSCFKQGNHKQKVSCTFSLAFPIFILVLFFIIPCNALLYG